MNVVTGELVVSPQKSRIQHRASSNGLAVTTASTNANAGIIRAFRRVERFKYSQMAIGILTLPLKQS